MPPPTASLQHTIVRTLDAEAMARLLSEVAGLRIGKIWHNFLPLSTPSPSTSFRSNRPRPPPPLLLASPRSTTPF